MTQPSVGGPALGRSHPDALIVGGGLLGAAVGYGLACKGIRVTLLDEGDTAFRAARGNAGLVWLQGKGDGSPAYAAWTRQSIDLWPSFAAQLCEHSGIDVNYRRLGGLVLCLNERELIAQRALAMRMQSQTPGYESRIIDSTELKEFLPQIGPEVVGGAYSSLDGDVNSLGLFRALHEAIRRVGGRYLPGCRVESFRRQTNGYLARTTHGDFSSGLLVIAAGLGSLRLGSMLGVNVPVRPQRGQIIVTERIEPFLKHIISSARQTQEGSVVIGDSMEEAGFDDVVSPAIVSRLASRACRMIPMLSRMSVVRTWAALRIMSPDGLPIYHPVASHPGAYVTTCHSGVTLAAAHVLILASGLLEGASAECLTTFSADRFLPCFSE